MILTSILTLLLSAFTVTTLALPVSSEFSLSQRSRGDYPYKTQCNEPAPDNVDR